MNILNLKIEEKRFRNCLRCKKEMFSKSDYCKNCNQYFFQKKIRVERKAKHLCYDCGKKVEPIYPVRCNCCNSKKKTQV